MRNWAKSRKNRPRGSMAAGQAKPVLTLIMLHYFPNTAIINKTPALPIRRPPSMIALNQQTELTNSEKPPPLSLSNPLPAASGLDFCLSTLLGTHTRNVKLHGGFFCLLQGRKIGLLEQACSPLALLGPCWAQGTQSPLAGQTQEQPKPAAGRHPCHRGIPLASLLCCQGHF